MLDSSPQQYIAIGHIGSAYGLKGWVNIISYTQIKNTIIDYSPWYLKRTRDNEVHYQQVKITQIRKHGKGIVALLAGCDDRNAAETFKNVEIVILAEQLPKPDKDEYYWHDLIGLTVTTLNAVALGVVSDIMETGANDVLVVTQQLDKKKKTRLIPFIRPSVVTKIDLQDKSIEVDWDPDF